MHDAIFLTLPGAVTRRATPLAGETVAGFLSRTGWPTATLPTVCAINGAPVLRAQWPLRALDEDDRLAFIAHPMGGGRARNKQVLGLVAMIGLSLLAPGVGELLGGALVGKLGAAAFLLGGAFAVSTLVAVKAGSGDGGDADGVYAFGQQRNSAQLLQPIAVSYGRTRKKPAYAAVPWAEYSGNDQFLNVLLCQGSGRYDTEAIYVDDTLLWAAASGVASGFEGVSVQICPPGTPVTLFPVAVATAAEVSGQELSGTWAGGFVSAPSGTTTTALALDIAAPGGIGYTSEDGTIIPYFVPIYAEARIVDDLGLPRGEWAQILHTVVSGATKKAQRWSFKAPVPEGRYQVRCRRGTHPLDDDAASMSTLMWMGLRAFLGGGDSFAHEQVIALRMKATQQLTDASASNIAVADTRILKVFDGTAWVEQPTRSPAWAFYDIATNAGYGAKRPLSKVDVQAVHALDHRARARGDCFDYEFSASVMVPEALDTALAAIRAKHRWAGDVLTLVRDEWREVPLMLITDRETVRGSFKAAYEMLPADGVDAVVCEYVDEETWRAEEVQYPPGYAAKNPKRVELKGVVQREQAYREAGFYYRQHIYRRVSPSLDMEHDGRLVSLGDHVAIQSDLPGSWGCAGLVAARAGLRLTLEPAPAWAADGQHYVLLRTKTGGAFGPVKCRQGGDDRTCVLDADDLALVEASQGISLDAVLVRRDGAEPPGFAHGVGTAWQRRCIAVSGAPGGDRVSLTFVVDDPRVHDDGGTPDPLPTLPVLGTAPPVIGGLIAAVAQNVMEPLLTASWWAADGATHYRARISYDQGATWLPLPDVTVPSLSVVVQPAALWLQVQGVGTRVGAWTQVEIAEPEISSRNITITADNFEAGLREQVAAIEAGALDRLAADTAALGKVRETAEAAQTRVALALAAAAAAGELAAREDNRNVAVLRDRLAVEIGAASAAIEEARTVFASADAAVAKSVSDLSASILGTDGTGNTSGKLADVKTVFASADAALASQLATLTAALDGVAASVTVKAVASASVPSGAVAAYQVTVAVDGAGHTASGGLLLGVFGNATDGYTSRLYLQANSTFFMDGAGARALFALTDGKAYLNADLIASGSITAAKLDVGSLSSISANIGTITAGAFLSPDGKVHFNLSAGYLLFRDG